MKILCINSGSSSLKFAFYDGKKLLKEGNVPRKKNTIKNLFKDLKTMPDAVGHRMVHGKDLIKPQRITPQVLQRLKKIIPFAPLHLPAEIAAIEEVKKHFPKIPQVACFDTAFHLKIPKIAKMFSLPRKFFDEGVHRYGFHGLSYEYIVSKYKPKPKEKTIICHLGSGASMVALLGKKPIDTSMGLTPMGGFMMGTRTGDLDPGALFYLMRKKKLSPKTLEKICDEKSGLLGVSGISSDMKILLEKKSESAKLAIEMFCYQARKTIGAFAAALHGLDTLIFTGGMGENSKIIRKKIEKGLTFLSYESIVIPTNEDLIIAKHVRELLL